ITLLELSRVPLDAHARDPLRALAALGQLAQGAATEFGLQGALLLGVAAAVAWTERQSGRRRRAGYAALFALGLAVSGLAREVLIEHPPFAWSLPATVGFFV